MADDESYEPYSLIELGRLERQSPSFYNDVNRDVIDEGIPALRDYTYLFIPWGKLQRVGRWADDAWKGGKAGAAAVVNKGKNVVGWIKGRFRFTPKHVISEGRLKHIFRNADGHFPDNPANRKLLLKVADDSTTTIGTDKWGNTWSARNLDDGTQIWTQTRKGELINGGINPTPRTFNPETGLSAPVKPKG